MSGQGYLMILMFAPFAMMGVIISLALIDYNPYRR